MLIVENELEKLRNELQNNISQLEKVIFNAEERSFYESCRRNVEKYLDESEKLLKFSKTNQKDTALSLFLSDSKKVFYKTNNELQRFSEWNKQNSEVFFANTNDNYQFSTILLIILLSVLLILGIILAFVIANSIVKPLRKAEIAAKRIAEGDLNFDIDVSANDEISDLSKLFQMMKDSLLNLTKDITRTTKFAIEGKLSERINVEKHKGEYQSIVEGINNTIENMVAPINLSADYVRMISEGKLPPKITEKYNGDFNILKNNLNRCVENLENFINSMIMLSKQHDSGEIDAEIDEMKFEGSFHTIVKGINSMTKGYTTILKKSMDCISEFNKGHFETTIETFVGKKAFVNSTIESLRTNLKNINTELNMLINSAKDGKLSVRGNESNFQGDWRVTIAGLNEMLQSITVPLNVTANCLAKFPIGIIPELDVADYKGEFNVMKNNLNLLITSQKSVVEKVKLMSKGDLTVELKARSEEDELVTEIIKMIQAVEYVVGEVKEASANVAAGSMQMSEVTETISQGASEQASSSEEVSSSMEEISENINQNTENAQQTKKIAMKAAEDIAESNKSVIFTAESVRNIAEKIALITEIAHKTDILAINAAVEAARAGEQGKGFAVVASEVRKLAERSQITANEINELSKIGMNAAERSGKLLADIVPQIQRTSKLVQEITASSLEQSTGATQVNKAIQQFTQVTQENAAASEELATSSEELASQAEQLKSVIAFFKTKEDRKIQTTESKKFAFEKPFEKKSFKVNKKTTMPHLQTHESKKGFHLNLKDDNLDDDFEKM